MSPFEAKQLRYDCLECKAVGSVELEIKIDREEEAGFAVTGHRCLKCGDSADQTELSAAEILGL